MLTSLAIFPSDPTMPLPTRHIVPKNVGRKYSAQKNDEEYAEYFFQLPGGPNAVERKPKRYSSADGAVDANDTTSYSSIKDEEQNNPRLVGSREEAANRVIANIIRQIASLSEHAHGVFGIN